MADASNLVMPKLGLTMTEGTITEWRIQPGQSFDAGQVIAVVETEKIANEIEAPDAGILDEYIVDHGQTVPVGTPIARWSLQGGNQAVSKTPERENEPIPRAAPAPRVSTQRTRVNRPGSRIVATPLARRIARDTGVNLKLVTGSGPGGRIKAADVLGQKAKHQEHSIIGGAGNNSNFLIAEVRANDLMALLSKLQETLDTPPPKLLHFACLAVARTSAQRPNVDKPSNIEGIRLNVGFVKLGSRNDTISVLNCSPPTSLKELIQHSSLLEGSPESSPPHDTESGSVVVADATEQGNTYVNFPIPPGHSATLGIGAVRESLRPDADKQPAIYQEIGLTLTYDRAAMNHATASNFLNAVKNHLEHPLRLLAG